MINEEEEAVSVAGSPQCQNNVFSAGPWLEHWQWWGCVW